jgi:hypothetical protein
MINPNRKHDSVPKSVERTGEKEFVVKHDDGTSFEGKVDHPARFEAFRKLKSYGRITSFGGVGEYKALICDNCKNVVHKLTYKNDKYFCENCKEI